MQTILGLKIKDDDDPIKNLSILKATYLEVVATGKVAFDTLLFTIAMLRDLQASFDPLARSEPIPIKEFDTRSHFHLRANRV
jgi:hypothetical protein